MLHGDESLELCYANSTEISNKSQDNLKICKSAMNQRDMAQHEFRGNPTSPTRPAYRHVLQRQHNRTVQTQVFIAPFYQEHGVSLAFVQVS